MKSKLLDLKSDELFSKEIDEIEVKQITKMDIAVIGISGKFGSANNVDDFWEAIKKGKDLVGELSESRKKDARIIANNLGIAQEKLNFLNGAFLNEIDKFDHKFFSILPREASLMDPNHRIFLQTAWEAIEDGGYGGDKIKGSNTGVFVGHSTVNPSYENAIWNDKTYSSSDSLVGNISSILASRISYILDMKGPCVLVDTACSSSLVSIHLACQAIKSGECDMALAGGINLMLLPVELNGNDQVGISSHDGKTRAFDDKSDGTGLGEGVCAVLLKPLTNAIKDNDNIYAVIKGSATNNDGNSVGITAPNANAQKEVILKAWEDAKIKPEEISYIEAHGTGTKLGDPIEVYGIENAFREYTDNKQFCAIGSVKTNIGHLNNAAGIAGFVKAVLALHNKEIPPIVHFRKPNSKIAFEDSPVYINNKLKKWDVNGYSRKCGVSSFGLSGTNCHMILEEAPVQTPNIRIKEEKYHIFTLSSKDKALLQESVQSYITFLSKENHSTIEEIIYTQNTGRGHYTHRLSMVVKDKLELKEKLEKFLTMGLNEVSNDQIFFKSHKIVSENKKNLEKNDITKAEKIEISNTINKKIKASKEFNERVLYEICEFYVSGADIDWTILYEGNEVRKVSLPLYQFQNTRCWIRDKKRINMDKKSLHQDYYGDNQNSLLGSCIVETMNQKIYASKCNINTHWLLNEHKILGNNLLVGTAYIDLAIQAYMKYNLESDLKKVELKDIALEYPLFMNEGTTTEMHTIVKVIESNLDFIIASKEEKKEDDVKEQWIQHASGKMCELNSVEDKKYDIKEIITRCNKKIVEFNSVSNGGNIQVSERWNTLKKIYVGEDEVLGQLKVPKQYQNELNDFKLYPPILDCAIHVALGGIESENMYLPFFFKSIKVHKHIEEEIYSYVKLEEKAKDTIVYNITLLNKFGDVLVEINNYTMKKENIVSVKNNDNFFSMRWIKNNADKKRNIKGNSILMFGGKDSLSDTLMKKLGVNNRIIHISLGEKYEKIHDCKYFIRNREEDYIKLFHDLKEKGIDKILHTLTIENNNEIKDIAQLQNSMGNSFYSLFYLTKGIIKNNITNDIKLYAIAPYVEKVNDSEKMIVPENATLFGIARVMEKENSNLKCTCIDVDKYTDAELIISEINNNEKQDKVAFREGTRYVEEFSKEEVDEFDDKEIQLKEDGVYIITGGAGGIALEISKYLSSFKKINIALISRSQLPTPSELNSFTEGNKFSKIYKAIEEIESNGSKVLYYSADISSTEDMETIIQELRIKYGTINGIIHCAGVPGDGLIITKEESRAQEVLKCKVEGTWILNKLTIHDDLDFFVMFSSLNSMLIGEGQSDYTAANAYLDSFSDYRNLNNKRALTINWPSWSETGMALKYGVNHNDVFKPLTTVSAIEGLHKVMNKNINRITIGELNYKIISEVLDTNEIRISEDIKDKVRKKSSSFIRKNNKREKSFDMNIKLAGRSKEKYTLTEKKIARVWSEILELQEVDIYDSFYELGGDSIFAMKIVNKINTDFDLQITIMDVLNYQSIYELSKHIEKKNEDAQGYENQIVSGTLPQMSKDGSDYYSVSSGEKRLFIIEEFEDIGTNYNVPVGLLIEGNVNKARFEKVISKIIQRHEILRTNFEEIDGELYQKVNEEFCFKLDYKQIDKDKGIKNIIEEFIKPFNLKKDLLIRGELIKLKDDNHVLLLDLHHIITDWTSTDIFVEEFIKLYQGIELPELDLQYKDYCAWQNKSLKEDTLKSQREFWKSTLANYNSELDIPTDYPRGISQKNEGDKIYFRLDEKKTKKIYELAEKYNTTVFTIMAATYSVLFSKFTGKEDIIIGTPISGRINEKLNNMMGMFVNMLPIRFFPKKDLIFEEYLNEVKNNCLQAFNHQEYPFELLIDELKVERDFKRNALFDGTLSFYSTNLHNIEIGDLKITPYDIEERSCKFDLGFDVVDMQSYIELILRYKVTLFKKETMKGYLDCFKGLLDMIIENPKIRIKDMEVFNYSQNDVLSNKSNIEEFEKIEFEF